VYRGEVETLREDVSRLKRQMEAADDASEGVAHARIMELQASQMYSSTLILLD
jgi:hypothetical protein